MNRSNPDSALIRGLKLLEHILQSADPVRFSGFREALPGVPDSTLTRLLRSLEEHGYIFSAQKSGYTAGPALQALVATGADRTVSQSQAVERAVRELVRRTNESAAFVKLEADHLSVLFSLTAPGAVSVLPAGGILHFEMDHAAALAVLRNISARVRKRLLGNRYSRIPSAECYNSAVETCRQPDGSFLDRSNERPGICRMAVPVRKGNITGALFLCLTERRAKEASDLLRCALEESRDLLIASLS